MSTPRFGHSCTYVDNKIIVQGGALNLYELLDSVEVLDLSSGEGWVLWKPLPRKTANQAMTTASGRIFYFGGDYYGESKAEKNDKLMEISLLNKREKLFQSYNINKHPRYRDHGHTVQWFALSPHSNKVLDLIPCQGISVPTLWVLSVSARGFPG